MKALVIFFLVFTLQVLPQESAPQVEIFFGTENMGINDPVPTFNFTAKSFVWETEVTSTNCNNWSFPLSDNYTSGSYTPAANNQAENVWSGFDFVSSRNAGVDSFAYGLYKFSTSNGKFFYLDYRDERIGCDNYGTVGHAIDIWIKYVGGQNPELKYKVSGTAQYQTVNNGTYLAFWVIKNAGTQHTDDLEYYWTHALAIIPSAATQAHPYLIWGPYPDAGTLNGNIVKYIIYKSSSHVPGYEPSGFSALDSVDSDEYSYIDFTEDVGNGDNAKSYYVTALVEYPSEGTGETGGTNIVEVELAPPSKAIANNSLTIGYGLSQNFPNPFNPVTSIGYSLGKDDYVHLKVFNPLGEQVAELVNSYQTAGSHSVEFNSSELPGGVYIYRIECTGFTDARKMILMK